MNKLLMVLVGCKPKGRHIEQHDVFFGIAENIKDLIPEIKKFWPEAKGKMHIDGWRAVSNVNGYRIEIVSKQQADKMNSGAQLFFINLGGYKPNEFEEFHYKMIVAAKSKNEAIKHSKQTTFFKHTGFEGAYAHIDDKYGVDVDDIYAIEDILSEEAKANYKLILHPAESVLADDEMHLGYFPFHSF